MDWTIFLQVTLPMAAGFGWMIVRMDKGFNSLSERINRLDSRLSRLEGKFDERGNWESHNKKLGE